MINFLKNKINLIWLIIGIAFLLRVIGVSYGLPQTLIGDEKGLIGGALKMLELKSVLLFLHPQNFKLLYYPPMLPYLYLIFFLPVIAFKYALSGFPAIDILRTNLILDPSIFWLTARFLSSIVGTATIGILYSLAKKIWGQRAGLLAALLLSVNFLHLSLSHFARHWVYVVFFSVLLLYLAFLVWEEPKRRYYYLAGLLGGLSFGVSYAAITALIPFIIVNAIVLKEKWNTRKEIFINIFCSFFIFMVLAVIFTLLHPYPFFRTVLGERSTTADPKNLIGFFRSVAYYARILFYSESFLLFFSILGGIVLFLKQKKIFLIFFSFIAGYLIIFYFIFHAEARYILPVIPIMCLATAYLVSRLHASCFMLHASCFLLFVPSLFISIRYDYLLLQPNSQKLAAEWLASEASGAKIISSLTNFELTPSKQAIEEQEVIDPSSLRTDDYVLKNISSSNYLQPNFNVLNFGGLKKEMREKFLKEKRFVDYDFWVVSRTDDILTEDVLAQLRFEPVMEFQGGPDFNGNFNELIYNMFKMERFGPKVIVYKIK